MISPARRHESEKMMKSTKSDRAKLTDNKNYFRFENYKKQIKLAKQIELIVLRLQNEYTKRQKEITKHLNELRINEKIRKKEMNAQKSTTTSKKKSGHN